MLSSSVAFCARMFIVEEQLEELDVWVHELYSYESNTRSGEDWVKEHIRETYCAADLREMFNLPEEGDQQVLWRGETWCFGPDQRLFL